MAHVEVEISHHPAQWATNDQCDGRHEVRPADKLEARGPILGAGVVRVYQQGRPSPADEALHRFGRRDRVFESDFGPRNPHEVHDAVQAKLDPKLRVRHFSRLAAHRFS